MDEEFVRFLQVPVASWFDDMSDRELLDLIPFFEGLAQVDNVYTSLKNANTYSVQMNGDIGTIPTTGS